MAELEERLRRAERAAEKAAALAAIAIIVASYRPRKLTIGERLWRLL